jgi:chorismate mutase/prephenate dehydratase
MAPGESTNKKRTPTATDSASLPNQKRGRRKAPAQGAQLRQLDDQIVSLLNQRAELAETEAKGPDDGPNATSAATEPDDVERAVARNKGPLEDRCIAAVFRELVSGCRARLRPLQVAFLGPEHSYSHQAAVKRFGHSVDLVPVATISAVFDAVIRGDVQYGLVPLENSTDGRIADTLEMFVRTPVRISGEVPLRIHHHLLGKCRRDEIREVGSKPQAMSQCRNWLSQHLPKARLVPMASTTVAAETAAKKPGVAAIASHQAGVTYGLNVLAEHIEDNPHNVTRFAVIGHQSAQRTGHDITSLMFQLEHKPGALADSMAIFKRNRLNLTWIESFPLPGTNKEYLFFVELEGYETDLRVRRAIESLRRKTERLEILGSYAHTEPID